MSNILIVNSGSRTIKFDVFSEHLESSMSGIIDDNNGVQFVRIKTHRSDEKYIYEKPLAGDETPVQKIVFISQHLNIGRIGFRIVHGGEKFIEPMLLTDESVKEIEKYNDLAPLHNPRTLQLIAAFKTLLPNVPMFGVFDTAFHQTIEPTQFLYGLPYEIYEKYEIRKYGFHGISHKYVSQALASLEPHAKKVIICHLGSGSSVTAVLNGKSFDTSMGFTPLEGLMMTTRPGDVDDGAISYLKSVSGVSDKDIEDMENYKSGLLGVSGISFDMRTLLEAEKNNYTRAHLAIEMYVYHVVRYIGSYVAAMDGVDTLVFTAGIGAGSDAIRERICKNLSFANLAIDPEVNAGKIDVEQNLKISKNDSKPIWIIPTNEELQIAKEICSLATT